jgi:hypothetical protein
MAAVYFVTKQVRKAQTNTANKDIFTAATASIICTVTGCLFSYPVQILPITIQTVLCLSIINSFPTEQPQIELSKRVRKIIGIMLVALSILLIIHYCFYLNYKQQSKQTFEFGRSGFKQKALETYRSLAGSYINDGSVLYQYAQQLYYNYQLERAKEAICSAKKYYCSNEVYKLSAAIENELQNYVQAEKDYKTAVYMVPNRMLSRKDLLDFYIERNDTTNAIYWARSIINMPVKIPSGITNNIQGKTKLILNTLVK